jgi:hypothetical protein
MNVTKKKLYEAITGYENGYLNSNYLLLSEGDVTNEGFIIKPK